MNNLWHSQNLTSAHAAPNRRGAIGVQFDRIEISGLTKKSRPGQFNIQQVNQSHQLNNSR